MQRFKAKANLDLASSTNAELRVETPHKYGFKLTTDFGRQFANPLSSVSLTHLKLAALLKCDVVEQTYPDTFTAQLVFNDSVSVEAKAIFDYGKTLNLQANLLARLTP